MLIVGILSWWYGEGWKQRVVMQREKLASTMDYFSIDLLLRTFFSPFRQISAGKVNGPIGVQLRAFSDRLISRMIGAMVRLFMIVIGTLAIIMYIVIGAAWLIAWAFVPFLPIIGVVLFLAGWMPWM
ncbi:MAG TPA: hypothetical protein VLG09_03175 [Candidatus Saccharimonadales bacterium]|nr:hypothetical protein [Candidatus Saccharimonadales bacterium]